MPRNVPLKTVKRKLKPAELKKKMEIEARKKVLEVSPFDVILGRVDIEYSYIPEYM